MATIIIRISPELKRKIALSPDVNPSEVVRRALIERVELWSRSRRARNLERNKGGIRCCWNNP
ncbi:MAG: hypothetical protein QW486_07525 [Candidatus Bathyarchaeia archaeon]